MSSVQFSSGMLQAIPGAPENKPMEHPIQVAAVKKHRIQQKHCSLTWHIMAFQLEIDASETQKNPWKIQQKQTKPCS